MTESETGFFELADAIWAEADQRRGDFKDALGDDIGNFVADVRQYGAGWTGDVWEWTAIGAENHPAFATIPERHPWDFVFRFAESSGASKPSDWGGWTKPHKERSLVGRMIEMSREGDRVSYVTMPESYL